MEENFSKAQDISFTGREGKIEHAYTTSWGVSTRLIGTLIMAHSDDDGLVLPPRVATQQVVILPVTPKEDSRQAVLDACHALAETLRHHKFHDKALRVHVDDRDVHGKKWEWVKKGAPIRIEIGPRDLEGRKVCVQRRDRAPNEKEFIEQDEFIQQVDQILQHIHDGLLERALHFRDQNIGRCGTMEEFDAHWAQDNPGWLQTPWEGSSEQEEELSKKHKITIRCIPLEGQDGAEMPCPLTGTPTRKRVIWGRSY